MQLQHWQRKAVYAPATKRKSFNSKRIHLFNFGPDTVEGVDMKPLKLGEDWDNGGHFSKVTVHDTIVKGQSRLVPRKDSNNQEWEFDGKLTWLLFCRENQGLYGVPEVLALRIYKDCFVYAMRKYTGLMQDYELPGIETMWNEWRTHGREHVGTFLLPKYIKCVETLDKYKAWLILHGYKVKDGYETFDLHNENSMLHNGDIILIDPHGYGEKSYNRKVH